MVFQGLAKFLYSLVVLNINCMSSFSHGFFSAYLQNKQQSSVIGGKVYYIYCNSFFKFWLIVLAYRIKLFRVNGKQKKTVKVNCILKLAPLFCTVIISVEWLSKCPTLLKLHRMFSYLLESFSCRTCPTYQCWIWCNTSSQTDIG